jgi:hypothetical protein
VFPQPHDRVRGPHPRHPMLPVGKALISCLAHSGVIGSDVLSAVGCQPTSSALPDIESSGVFPARCAVLWPLLTPRGISSSGSPQVRTRCVPTRPPHLPPRVDRTASLCCASSPSRVGLSMRFLYIGPSVSCSLPSPGWLPSRSWLRVVVVSCTHERSSDRGLSPHLQRAHAGRTQIDEPNRVRDGAPMRVRAPLRSVCGLSWSFGKRAEIRS